MHLHPYLSSELVREKQLDMIGRPQRSSTARCARASTWVFRNAASAIRWLGRYRKRRPAVPPVDPPAPSYEHQKETISSSW